MRQLGENVYARPRYTNTQSTRALLADEGLLFMRCLMRVLFG